MINVKQSLLHPNFNKTMKKLTFLVAFTMLVNVAFSNGLLTNTNQSAQFIRMMSRNASLGIDAVYYNPAGLIKLENGWHFSVNSQTIFQTKTIDSKFPWLNDGIYEGVVQVPVFPSGFAVYKKDKLALSFGFGPNAGGGTATFERGLPSFEIPITKIVPAMAGLTLIDPSLAVSGYDANLTFDGSSIFWGFQLGATYAINEMLSVSAGVRYMPATNKYVGSIKDITLKVGSEYFAAPEWLEETSGTVNGYAQQAAGASALFNGGASSVQPIIDEGGGAYTLAQLEGAGFITASERMQLAGGLNILGFSPEQIGAMDAATIQGTYSAAGAEYAATSATLSQTALSLSATSEQLEDKEVDTEQTGAGFTPILGLNISPNDNLNIGIRYEHKTYLSLKNSTKIDDLGLFPDGAESGSDIPGILGIGIGYTDNYWFEAQLSFNMYFDKYVDWGANVRDVAIWQDLDPTQIRAREVKNNSFDIALGLQFNVTDKFSVSAGGMYEKAGVEDSFNSDFSYSAPSYIALGAGVMWKITDQLTLDAGVSNVFYQDAKVRYFDPHLNSNYDETYGKKAFSFALGLSYSIPY